MPQPRFHLALVLALALHLAATPAAAAATAACAAVERPGLCFQNPDGRLATKTPSTPDACCAACQATAGCRSWTHWTEEASSTTHCNLFKNVAGKVAQSNCVSGYGNQGAPPNLLYFFPDTLAAWAFNDYNADLPANVTPAASQFLRSGATRFETAVVAHTQCSPSRCTMLTGRYQHVGGHRTQTHLIRAYEPNYFRSLKDAGYYVKVLGKNDAFSAMAANVSVSNWTNLIGYNSGQNAFEYGYQGYYSFLNTGANVSGADPANSADYRAVLEAIDFLNSDPPQPFVIFLPTRGAHPPYGAPLEWHNKFSPEQVRKTLKLRPSNVPGMPTYTSFANGIPHYRNLTGLDQDVFYKIAAVYLGMISYTDWQFGQLLAGLDRSGLANSTVVAFSSDHGLFAWWRNARNGTTPSPPPHPQGDFGGSYSLVEKWPGSLSNLLTEVPMYVRVPGAKAAARGFSSKSPIQSMDLLETMLDLAGINETWVRFGTSLRPQVVEGIEGDMSRFVYSEGGFHGDVERMIEANECLSPGPKGTYYPRGLEEAQPNGSPRAVMVQNATHKLVYRPTGVSELWDYRVDRTETTNLYQEPAYAQTRAELMQHLTDWLVLTSDVTPLEQDSRGWPRFPNPVDSNCIGNPSQPGPNHDDGSAAPGGGSPRVTDYYAINGVVE